MGAAGEDRQDVAGGVPEPATWAMMLLGLGAIGAAMRATRRRAVGSPSGRLETHDHQGLPAPEPDFANGS